MQPPDSPPDEQAKRDSTFKWWRIAVALLVPLLLASIFIPVYGTASPKSPRTLYLSQLKGVFPALKMYAGDHEGKFPLQLSDVEPYYLKPGTIARLPRKDPKSGQLVEPLYFPGYTQSCPPETILLATTLPIAKCRLVVFASGSANAILETKYQELLKKQPPREW